MTTNSSKHEQAIAPDAKSIEKFLSEHTFLDLRVHWAFERIFGTQKHESFLTSLLNAVILADSELKKSRVPVNIEYFAYFRDEGSVKDSPAGREFFGVQSIDSECRRIILQMRLKEDDMFYIKRVAFHIVKRFPATEDPAETEVEVLLNEIHYISILNYIDKITEKYTEEEMGGRKKRRPFGPYRFTIWLPLFNKKAENCLTKLDRFIYTIKNTGELKEPPLFAKEDEFFGELYEALRLRNLDEEEIRKYLKEISDTHSFS